MNPASAAAERFSLRWCQGPGSAPGKWWWTPGRPLPHAGSAGVDVEQGAAKRPGSDGGEVRVDMPLGRTRPSEDEVPQIPPMISHKTKRGAAALARLKAYEGIPPPYDKKKRMVIPDALKVLRLKLAMSTARWEGFLLRLDGTITTQSRRVSATRSCLWVNFALLMEPEELPELETKRREKSQVTYERKKQLTKLRLKAEKVAEEKLGPQLDILAPIKY
ncbi:hypothetical protein RHSIM_Rhsim02G0056800 [Rhododendron simsii]|uniref:Uncharacterized protein n=1 Tax=Rhododendron simsii TaxID=118357 RepID=A0A834H921_RHOSS|nr:hypothetical protein RHSIM_Rhsim02G0056800 [Rhododendron simsii]